MASPYNLSKPFYLEIEGKAQGPFSASEVSAGLKSGDFGEPKRYWQEGMPEWLPFAPWVETMREMGEGTPPPPPVPLATHGTGAKSFEAKATALACPECQTPHRMGTRFCTQCGAAMDPARKVEYVAKGASDIEGLIPVSNPPALWAYYLGLFSIIPVLGLPSAVAAIILGAKGRLKAATLPNNQGKAHAWIGIVLGWAFLLFQLLIVAIIVIGVMHKPR